MIYGERTYRTAYRVSVSGEATPMDRVPYMSGSFNEAWLQRLIAENPSIIPSGEVAIEYAPLVCIGTEVPVGEGENRGVIDNLYVTPSGYVVIVETKLFRNQESRRAVVAQLIDYAKEVQKWDAPKLDEIASKYFYKDESQASRIIDEMVRRGYLEFSDEAALTDAINTHLQEAAFLLLVVGDGIRSNVYRLAEFLNENTSMSFNLALVEIETYQDGDGFVCVPNLLTKTTVIERRAQFGTVSFFKGDDVLPVARVPYQTKPILSRDEFIETLADNGGYDPDDLRELIADLEIISGVSVHIAPTELHIRVATDDGGEFSLLTFGISGGHCDLWLVPSRIRESLENHGVYPFEANPFLESYKSYVDLCRVKAPPYDRPEGFYYADLQKVIDNTNDFVAAVERFVTSISNR